MKPYFFILVLVLPLVWAAFAVDVILHSMWWKRKRHLCWKYRCSQKVGSCRATEANNGPMCDEHCLRTHYHQFFVGCGTPDGIPIIDKLGQRLVMRPPTRTSRNQSYRN